MHYFLKIILRLPFWTVWNWNIIEKYLLSNKIILLIIQQLTDFKRESHNDDYEATMENFSGKNNNNDNNNNNNNNDNINNSNTDAGLKIRSTGRRDQLHREMNEWMDWLMNESMEGRMDGWMERSKCLREK